MKRIYYRKLIRDKIPQRIEECGGAYKIDKLSRSAFIRALIKKVEEEASGLTNAKTRDCLLLELDDILAIIEEIIKVKRITKHELRHARHVNLTRKGGFKRRLFLVWTSDTGYKTNERVNEDKRFNRLTHALTKEIVRGYGGKRLPPLTKQLTGK